MWCYQKPGFEALLLAELQRQQQRSQFCDTLLNTEGVSVPAHSCVLSAISPNISSALSSAPPPPAGQSRLLEFRTLDACSLLHMVRLLYCGEMAGEGEKERQEAISAAARLGIHGLVEVTKREPESRNGEGEGRHAEVGVQTEPLMSEENDGRRGWWRREVRDGSTFLWKERLSDGEKETWTQTEEEQVNTASSSHPAASYDTIDMAALQSLGHTDSHLVPSQIPYIPVSLVYPPDNQTLQPSPALVDSMQGSTAAGHTSVLSFSTPGASAPQSWWAAPQGAAGSVAAAEEWEDERLEQFQGNIPGYINYFLNPEKQERRRRGRPRGRRGAGAGGARRAGTGERRARRPRARTAGRGRGGLMQTVDVQDVGVSKLQMLFLQRWGLRSSRTGQGGGAAGRKLYLKTREVLKPNKSHRRRGRGKVWEVSESGDVLLHNDTQRGGRRTTAQFNQDGLPVVRSGAKPTASASFSSPQLRFYTVQTSSPFSPSLQPSPSPAASLVSSAPSLLHSTPLPPPPPPPLAPPPHEEQPEHIDRLLEEVMMGLDILPNNSDAARSLPSMPTSSSSSTQNKQQGSSTSLLEASPASDGPHQVVAVARGAGSSTSANSEAPVLQQQGEGELNEMLNQFLQSFERHIENCTDREEGTAKTPLTPHLQNTHTAHQHDEAETQQGRPHKATAHNADPPKPAEKAKAPARRRRRKNEYLFSLERKRVRVRKPKSASDEKTKIVDDLADKQLKQMPVVKLERRGPLPARVTLQERSCLEVKKPSKAATSSSSVTRDRPSEKPQTVSWTTKTYPIRSRFRQAQIMDSMPFLEEPLLHKRPPSADLPSRRPNNNKQLLSLPDGSSTPPVQPRPAEPREETEGPARRGEKRGAESEEDTSDDATVAKRVCFEQIIQPTSETLGSESATRELKDSFSVDYLQRQQQDEEPAWSEFKLRLTEESLTDEDTCDDEMIDVGGPPPPLWSFSRSSHSTKGVTLGSMGGCEEDKDEDIDVIGGSSPAPGPVVIDWTESSEGEEEEEDEDIDVMGEKTDDVSLTVFAAVSKGELVNRKYQTEMLRR